MPLLRLAAGGYLGGEFVNWAKDKIKSGVSGEKHTRIDEGTFTDPTWERVINNYAAVGSFGIISDVFASGWLGEFPIKSTVKFAVLPVQSQTIERVVQTIFQVATEVDSYGVKNALRRGVKPLSKISPLPAQLAKRAEKVDRNWLYVDEINTLIYLTEKGLLINLFNQTLKKKDEELLAPRLIVILSL